jgi:hypothetical protein
MIDLFISYKSEERLYAKRLFQDIKPYLSVWYDRAPGDLDEDSQGLEVGHNWRARLTEKLSESSCQVTLWSPQSVRSKFVLSEASQALNEAKQIDALLIDCSIPLPFGQRDVIDLRGWRTNPSDTGKWRLLKKVAEVVRDGALEQYAIQELLAHWDAPNANSIRYFDYAEMSECCDELRDEVRKFDPHLIFAPDARSGIWAEIFFDFLQYRVPVVVGPTAAVGDDPGYCRAGDVLMPHLLQLRRPGERILVVCDRITAAGEHVSIFHSLKTEFGFRSEEMLFIGLVGHAEVAGDQVKLGKRVNAGDLIVFYDNVVAQ